tara:strand:- start:474 stop:1286 length:813 start_codon:yes stop_codon:yes gene_type:complete
MFNKKITDVKIGIAISTFTEEGTDLERFNIIQRSLSSLTEIIQKTSLNTYVVLVVDGPVPQKHKDILDKYNFDIHQKKINGGVARAKNTSIRLLLEKNVDIGFLADDDVLYKEGCLEKYVNSSIKGGIHHLGFCQMSPIVHPPNEWKRMGYYKTTVNNTEVMHHSGTGVGCWLSFTPELIKKIGYFYVMPGKYGYEHINFTHRAIYHKMIPHACDILNPLDVMDHIGFEPIGYNKFRKSHSITENTRRAENNKNKHLWNKNLHRFIPLIE